MDMGIPGRLDTYKGKSFFSPNFPRWENIHVVNEMKKGFNFPVFIDNDVRLNLYGEWLYWAGVNSKNVILITLGTGLGSGIIRDGKVISSKACKVVQAKLGDCAGMIGAADYAKNRLSTNKVHNSV